MNTTTGSSATFFGSTRRFVAAAAAAVALAVTAATALIPSAASASAKPGITNVKWAGYAATGTRFAAASGTWTVPSVTCGQSDPRTTFVWVGLDGATAGSTTVEQAGTGITCNPDGTVRHFAWTEFYPNLSSILDTKAYPVQQGDVIATTITAGTDNFAVTMNDQRNGTTIWNYSATIASPGAAFSTAEWVVEAPSATAGGADLAIMPVSTTFTNVTATTAAGVTSGLNGDRFDWQPITLRQGDWTEVPSELDSTATSFSVTGGPYASSNVPTAHTWLTPLPPGARQASGLRLRPALALQPAAAAQN